LANDDCNILALSILDCDFVFWLIDGDDLAARSGHRTGDDFFSTEAATVGALFSERSQLIANL
jgi:hypothetical protein